MRSCIQCLENKWNFQYIDGWIRASCINCGCEIEFEAKDGKQCKKCGKYGAEFLEKQNRNWFYWKCKFCGFERRHERSWGVYKHKDGKTFLKANGDKKFREVILEIQKGLPVIILKQAVDKSLK